MRRAERLFQLMLLLQEGKVRTGQYLAEKLEVSTRTVYRDIADLVGSGIPIDGEAGVGYLLRDEYRLPPLMFTADELKALALGARMVRAWSDRELASTTATAIRKIESILPENLKKEIQLEGIEVPGYQMRPEVGEKLRAVRMALDAQEKLKVQYTSIKGAATHRIIRPLVLYFWGKTWTLGGWCELRTGFRSFRVDRMDTVVNQHVRFEHTDEISLQAYVNYQMENEW
jgi:predicted DNA-binding transcriptional regulator YafY